MGRTDAVGVDIHALRTEAERDGTDCIVTRRWLREVLRELEESRQPRPSAPPVLDFKTIERR